MTHGIQIILGLAEVAALCGRAALAVGRIQIKMLFGVGLGLLLSFALDGRAAAQPTLTVNFDAVDTTGGAVSGAALDAHLADFGITLTNVTGGPGVAPVISAAPLGGPNNVVAPSQLNILEVLPGSVANSYTLVFATLLKSFDFTRAGRCTSLAFPSWTAVAKDSSGATLSTVGEGSGSTSASCLSPTPSATFTFSTPGIKSVTFSSGNQGSFGRTSPAIDDLFLVSIGPIILTVNNGQNIANTFSGFVPDVINTNGAPFAVSGNQIAVVDPTNLAAQDEVIVDLTSGISSSVLNRLSGLRNGVAGVTASGPRPMVVGMKDDGERADRARQYWMQGFGAVRDHEGDGPAVDTDHQLAGFVSGMDAQYSAHTRAGFFLGGSLGKVSAAFNSQDTDVDSFFGGAYVSTLRGRLALDMALTVGYSDYDRERRVTNNLAAGGLQTARADYNGWFISPEITLTRPFWPFGLRLEKSVTLRYAGLFLDGFTETGAAAPLTVKDRDVHVGQARAQLAVPLNHGGSDGARSRLMLKGGVEARTQFGDRDVSGTLLAQNIVFDPGGDRNAIGAFTGLSVEHTTANGLTFHATVEGLIEDDGSTQVSGKSGVKFRF